MLALNAFIVASGIGSPWLAADQEVSTICRGAGNHRSGMLSGRSLIDFRTMAKVRSPLSPIWVEQRPVRRRRPQIIQIGRLEIAGNDRRSRQPILLHITPSSTERNRPPAPMCRIADGAAAKLMGE